MSSHALEVQITVIGGRDVIIADVHAAPGDVRQFIAAQPDPFLATAGAADGWQGNLPDPRRVPGSAKAVLERLRRLATVELRQVITSRRPCLR